MIQPRLLNALMFVVCALFCFLVSTGIYAGKDFEQMLPVERLLFLSGVAGLFLFPFAAIKTASKEE